MTLKWFRFEPLKFCFNCKLFKESRVQALTDYLNPSCYDVLDLLTCLALTPLSLYFSNLFKSLTSPRLRSAFEQNSDLVIEPLLHKLIENKSLGASSQETSVYTSDQPFSSVTSWNNILVMILISVTDINYTIKLVSQYWW